MYKLKYLKYKLKYEQLKSQLVQQTGGSDIPDLTNYIDLPIGINFECGKIITHILDKCGDKCVGWANCQIGMDAPYHGRVADETHRSLGRSELNFPGYQEDKLIENLTQIFEHCKLSFPDKKIIIQIARGRSGIQMFEEVLKPILEKKQITNYHVLYGYRSGDYFACGELNEQFVFINIGMFAVLTQPENIYVGELCNPVLTWNILDYDGKFKFNETPTNFSHDSKNILNNYPGIKKIKLFGIADNMKFITPDVYAQNSIQELIDYASQF
jgi:hypothetical protein